MATSTKDPDRGEEHRRGIYRADRRGRKSQLTMNFQRHQSQRTSDLVFLLEGGVHRFGLIGSRLWPHIILESISLKESLFLRLDAYDDEIEGVRRGG